MKVKDSEVSSEEVIDKSKPETLEHINEVMIKEKLITKQEDKEYE